MVSSSTPVPDTPKRSDALRDVAGLLAALACVAATGAAFWQAWAPTPGPAGAALDRYAPAVNGDASLLAVYDAGGHLIGWDSQNVAALPTLHGITYDLGPAIGGAVLERYAPPAGNGLSVEWARRIQLIEIRSRALDVHGALTTTTAVHVREAGGQFLAGIRDMSQGMDVVFAPFLHVYPPDLRPGATWHSEGSVSPVALTYRFEGQVAQAGPFESAAGRHDDCLRVETRLTLTAGNGHEAVTAASEWLCAGVGVVEYIERDAADTITRREIPASAAPGGAPWPPPAARLQQTPALADPANWRLSVFAKANLTGAELESAIPPVWLPLDPPILLAAAYNGDLLAFSAASEPGLLAWRFHTAGAIYSPPTFDAERGRIYFGATDKRLYALDARGLFLWSFVTGDNVATRPLLVSDTILFGSEDRHVYALDADTGALRWQAETGAAVVSAPVALGQTVMVGCDDGGVYAFDLASGELLWETGIDDVESFIEAPVVAAGDRALVASSVGTLAALDPAMGDVVWSARIGAGVRRPPAVGDGLAAVIDQSGRLTVLDSTDGRRLWRDDTRRYSGAPLIAAEGVLAVDQSGVFRLFDRAGRQTGEWATADHVTAAETGNRFDFIHGAVIGGEAIWAVNAKAIVWRLGP